MKKKFPAWTILTVVCLVAGVLLALVNTVTADKIVEQQQLRILETRLSLFPTASEFKELPVEESEYKLDSLVSSLDASGNVLGYVGQATVAGYGGPVQISAALDLDGVIQGISVGGDDFSETPGLGALAKEAAFTDQFKGKTPVLVLNEDGVDTVTGASKTSKAVVKGVNAIAAYIYTYELGLPLEGEAPSLSLSAKGGESAGMSGFRGN